LFLLACVVFVVLPIAVNRLTGFSELPILHGAGWLVASLVCYPAAAAVYQQSKQRPLRFINYYAVNLGIAVFAMSMEGLLAR
jgi:hypothetical protein